MKILAGSRATGFLSVLEENVDGASLHRVTSGKDQPDAAPGESDIHLLLLDIGNDQVVQIQLSQRETAILKAAIKSEGSWVYAQDE